jgi:hypothetical protein
MIFFSFHDICLMVLNDAQERVAANSVLTFPDSFAFPSEEEGAVLFAHSRLLDNTEHTNRARLQRLHVLKEEARDTAISAVLSENLDWFSDPQLPTNYSQLSALRYAPAHVPHHSPSQVPLVASASVSLGPAGLTFQLQVSTAATTVAFAVRLQLLRAPYSQSTDRLLPVSYSDNFFVLFPGDEPKHVLVSCDCAVCDCSAPTAAKLYASGWNVLPVLITPVLVRS